MPPCISMIRGVGPFASVSRTSAGVTCSGSSARMRSSTDRSVTGAGGSTGMSCGPRSGRTTQPASATDATSRRDAREFATGGHERFRAQATTAATILATSSGRNADVRYDTPTCRQSPTDAGAITIGANGPVETARR